MPDRACRAELAPHDLVLVADRALLLTPAGDPLPPPGLDALSQTVPRHVPEGWVVVRRGQSPAGHVPVGIRGASREDRFASILPLSAVVRVLRPWDLSQEIPAHRADLPAFLALATARDVFRQRAAEVPWGPGGSVGFELATGVAAVTGASDLDLVIRCDLRPDSHVLAPFVDLMAQAPCRVDVQVLTPQGGFVLSEWFDRTNGQVALRTATGPVLAADPWATP